MKRKLQNLIVRLCVLGAFVLQVSAAPSTGSGKAKPHGGQAERLPNVVLIFADDLGYGDLGCYGATKVQTPNIDQLAKDGRRFTDAHSASAVCTPSRYGLLTGEYPFRQGLWGPCHPNSKLLVNTNKLTIAKLLGNKGYETACFGKWHLGFGVNQNDWQVPLRPGPQDLGFDYYFGMPVVNSAPPYIYVENDRVVGGDPKDPLVYLGRNSRKKATPLTPITKAAGNRVANFYSGAVAAHKLFNDFEVGTTLAKRASEWIRERNDDPFFLYLATTAIHHPFTPAPRFQGTSQCGLYGDFIHELDWMVGEVMKALEQKGVADNTLVIFTSDNGGMFNHGGQAAFAKGHRQNADLLGFKFGVWEGGHRVPFIAKWPGQIKPGSTSSQLISGVDMLATFASLTGQNLNKKRLADSVNILPALIGEPDIPLRDNLILSPNKPTNLAIRKGKWVYIGAQGSGGFSGGHGTHAAGGPKSVSYVGSVNSDIENGKIKKGAPPAQLYDIDFDPRQTKNLYREYPEVVKELSALLKKIAPQRPSARNRRAPKRAPVKAQMNYEEFKPLGNLRFTFESGKLESWTIVEGEAGRAISDHASLPSFVSRPYNHEGKYHLSTIATRDKFSDQQQVIIQSPKFVIQGERASFLASGGFKPGSLYVGLVDAMTKEVLLAAGGSRGPQMKRTTWDVSKLKGKTVYLQVVDQSTSGWGHLTFDDFSVEGKLQADGKPKKK